MYEQIVEQVATRFGLEKEKTKQLLGMVIGLVFNEKRGGPAGFLQLFRDRGMGDTVASWLGQGPNQPLTGAQFETAVGRETVDAMSARLGLPGPTVSNAAAALLPDAMDALSEHGDVPTGGLSDKLRDWFGDLGEGWGHIERWSAGGMGAAAAAAGAGAAAVGAGVHKAGDAVAGATGDARRAVGAGLDRAGDLAGDAGRAAKSGGGKLLPWLLLGAAVIAAILLFRGCQKQEPATSAETATPSAATPAAAPAAQFDSRLVLSRNGDKVTYEGVVDSEATKASIIDALTKAYGAGNVSGNLTVDPNARTPGWLASLAGFLPQFTANGASLTFEGSRIDLGGMLADADKASLLDKLKATFGGFSFGGLFEGAGAAAATAAANVEAAAVEALDKLKPGAFTADDLVKALNLMIIHFDTGSANISAQSADILKKAAEAIKSAPAGTRIEVGGHTDNTGNAAANQSLSERRAAAVKTRLGELGVDAAMLTSKGYGQDKPVADNATVEGRAQNRRIEFTVL